MLSNVSITLIVLSNYLARIHSNLEDTTILDKYKKKINAYLKSRFLKILNKPSQLSKQEKQILDIAESYFKKEYVEVLKILPNPSQKLIQARPADLERAPTEPSIDTHPSSSPFKSSKHAAPLEVTIEKSNSSEKITENSFYTKPQSWTSSPKNLNEEANELSESSSPVIFHSMV